MGLGRGVWFDLVLVERERDIFILFLNWFHGCVCVCVYIQEWNGRERWGERDE